MNSAPHPRSRTRIALGLGLALSMGLACTKEAARGAPSRAPELQRAPAPSAPPAPAPSPPAEGARPAPQRPFPESSAGQAPPPSLPSRRPAERAPAPATKSRARSERGAEFDWGLGQDERERDLDTPQSLHRQLGRVLELATPDCPSARERKKAICDLAGQICQLVDRDPNVASVETYCRDAKQRCSEADKRTAERCGG